MYISYFPLVQNNVIAEEDRIEQKWDQYLLFSIERKPVTDKKRPVVQVYVRQTHL